MSSRQLRKLQKQKELLQLQDAATVKTDRSDDEELEPEPVVTKPRASLFAALGGDDNDEAEDAQSDIEHEKQEAQESAGDNQSPQVTSARKGKKKKKKKAKKAHAETETVAEKGDKDDGDIDQVLQELKLENQDTRPSAASSSVQNEGRFLPINLYNLKAIHEMRALFGKDAIETAEQEEIADQAAARRRQRPAARRTVDLETYLKGDPRKKLPEVSLRRNIFVQGKDYWPQASAGGLSMREIGPGFHAKVEYAFVFDKHYDAAQGAFWHVVQLAEPNSMVALLKTFPYHVSTLVQVSSIAKQDQNQALAADLCERALFTFGRVTNLSFRQNIEQGKAFLDFRRPENRQFFLTGYHYLKSLIRKGTYRTALEWAKLLFSLNHMDPYGMKNFIHVLAIRSYESRWFLNFCDNKELLSDNGEDLYHTQTKVLAKLQQKDMDGARESLVQGMERLPWLYCTLFQALNLEAPPPLWGMKADSPDREFWTELYIHQAKDIWNNFQAISLLKEAATLAKKADMNSLPPDPPCDQRTARLIFLEGATDLLVDVPRALLDVQPNYEFDPLPPPKEENIFTSVSTQLPWTAEPDRGASLQSILAARGVQGLAVAPADGQQQGDDFDDSDLNGGGDDVEEEDTDSEFERVEREHAGGILRAVSNFLHRYAFGAPADTPADAPDPNAEELSGDDDDYDTFEDGQEQDGED